MGFAEGGPAYFNRYAYTANDPINLIDPDGRNPAIDRRADQLAALPPEQKLEAAAAIVGAATIALPGPEDVAIGVAIAKGAGNLLKGSKATATVAERLREVESAVRNGDSIPSHAADTLSEVVDGMVENVTRQVTRGNTDRANDIAGKMKGLVDDLDRFDAVSDEARDQFKSRIDDALGGN